MNASEYNINFTIPKGKTGDIGPLANEPRVYAKYNTKTDNGNLSIQQTILLPPNTSFFTIDNENINFTETGFFEFTICGKLKEETTNSGGTLFLRTHNPRGYTNNLITIQLQDGAREKTFFQTKIGEYQTLQRVAIIFEKDINSNTIVEDVSLYIKRFPFSY